MRTKNYEFHMLYHAIHNFCTVDLSSIYLDVMKDTMYAESKDNVAVGLLKQRCTKS